MLNFKAALTDLANANAFPADLDTGGRKAMLNDALERLFYSGRFLGTEDTIKVFVDTTGVLTLPRHFKSIKGFTEDGVALPLASKWWIFSPGATTDLQKYARNAQPQSGAFAIFVDPTEPVRLQISGDAEGTVRIQGTDENGDEIFDQNGGLGFDITFEAEDPSTQYVSTISSVQMPLTDAPKVLSAVYDDTTVQVLGHYEPGETNPAYTRYYLPQAVLKTDGDSSVTALCQRQFVACVADNDPVYPSNFGGRKNAVLAIVYENAGEEERSIFHFNQAISLLNAELKRSRPESEVGAMRIRVVGNPIGCGLRSTY